MIVVKTVMMIIVVLCGGWGLEIFICMYKDESGTLYYGKKRHY